MIFTKEQIDEIGRRLAQNGAKDTDFADATLPLTGKETLAIVQKGHNVQLPLEEASSALKEGSITLSKLAPDAVRSIINAAVAEADPIVIEGDVTNAPDEEDITSDNNDLLKFKDKPHSPTIYSGLGRKYLRKNLVNGVNTLTQDMFKTPDNTNNLTDTIFIIQYDYVIPQGTTINIPERCVLKFEGGSITTGTIIGNGTIIDAGRVKIFGPNVVTDVDGSSWNISEAYPEWFGAVMNDETVDNGIYINKTLDAFRSCNTSVNINGDIPRVPCVLSNGSYYTQSSIIVQGRFRSLLGSLTRNSYIISADNEATTPIVQLGYVNEEDLTQNNGAQGCHIENLNIVGSIQFDNTEGVITQRTGLRVGIAPLGSGDASGASMTRGLIRNIRIYRCDIGLYLDWQWCNTLDTFVVSRCNKGIVSGATTPTISNCQIETNYETGIETLENSSGIKIYSSIIEGNKYGCILNGGECSIINCYFEGNDESYTNPNCEKERISGPNVPEYTRAVYGGHIICGKDSFVENLSIFDCHITNTDRANNQIYVDKCNQLNISGDTLGIIPLKLTENCVVGSVPNSFRKSSNAGLIRNWLYTQNTGVKSFNPVYDCHDFSKYEQAHTSDGRANMLRLLAGQSYYHRITGNMADIEVDDKGHVYSYRREEEYSQERQIVVIFNIDPLCSRDKDLYVSVDYLLNKKEVLLNFSAMCGLTTIRDSHGSTVSLVDPTKNYNTGQPYAIIPNKWTNNTWISQGGGQATIEAGYPSSYHVIIPKEALQHKQLVEVDGESIEVYTYSYFQIGLRISNEDFVSEADDKLEENAFKLTGISIYEGDQIPQELCNNISTPFRWNSIRSIARDGFVLPEKNDSVIPEKGLTCFKRIDTYNNKILFSPSGSTTFLDATGRTPAINYGTTANAPTNLTTSNDRGYQYFNTSTGKPNIWNGTAWLESDGVIAGTLRSGTFAAKPTYTDNKLYVGFKYFCTNKQTAEGTTNGIEIIYKGTDRTDPDNPVDIWVDALGRVVS